MLRNRILVFHPFATVSGTNNVELTRINQQANTGLAVGAATGTYGGTTALKATLTDAGGAPLSGQTVTFTLNGMSVGSAMTNDSGVATLQDVGLAGINADTYSNGIGASFAGNSNYPASSNTGMLTVNQRAITVTADPQMKAYGDADPTLLTYQITSGSLVTSDTFSGSLTRVAGENVGSYAIQQGTLALSSNYTLTYAGANLTITRGRSPSPPTPRARSTATPTRP